MHKRTLGTDEVDEFLNLEHIPIAESYIHPNYISNTFDNDYWMIRLEWPSQKYADQVVSMDTPTDGLDLDDGQDHELTVFGFGTLSSGGSAPNVMREVDVDYKSNSNCGIYPINQLTSNMICAGRLGKDSCQVR